MQTTSASTVTHQVRTVEDFAALDLSFYTLCRLAEKTHYVYPHIGLPRAIERGDYKGVLVLDKLGNYVSFH